jgi:hypothetical protein
MDKPLVHIILHPKAQVFTKRVCVIDKGEILHFTS